MTRNVPDMERQKLSAEIALLESLDVDQLRARWKILYETEAPTRFSHDLLMRAVAYRIRPNIDQLLLNFFSLPFVHSSDLRQLKWWLGGSRDRAREPLRFRWSDPQQRIHKNNIHDGPWCGLDPLTFSLC
jgi:hypothetical protein